MDGGRVGISVQGDTRWDQRKSGLVYNSDSGAHLICGNLTSRCVAIECMSKRCASCEIKELAEKERIEVEQKEAKKLEKQAKCTGRDRKRKRSPSQGRWTNAKKYKKKRLFTALPTAHGITQGHRREWKQ